MSIPFGRVFPCPNGFVEFMTASHSALREQTATDCIALLSSGSHNVLSKEYKPPPIKSTTDPLYHQTNMPTSIPDPDHDDTSVSNSASSNVATVAPAIGEKETAGVFRLRLLVLLAMLLASIGVSLAMFFLASNDEDDTYKTQYEGSASKITSSFFEAVGEKLAAIGSLSVAATAFARSENITWPLVSLSDFQQRAAAVRELSKAYYIRILPVVYEEDRLAWEEFSLSKDDLLEEARAYQAENGQDFEFMQNEINFGNLSEKLFYVGEQGLAVDPGFAPYFPAWQESPYTGWDFNNYNYKTNPISAPYLLKTFETGQMTLGGLQTPKPGGINDEDVNTRYFARLLSFAAGKPVNYAGRPMCAVFLPVFDSFHVDSRKTTAMIYGIFEWGSYFEGLLPENSPALYAVLSNPCDGPFTYKVIGEEVEYLGPGDLHDTSFDDMEKFVDFAKEQNLAIESGLGITLNQDVCPYSLHVYPTQEFYDEYNSILPIVITCAVALVFLTTVGIFLLYNRLVENRQQVVLKQAVQSTAIVDSMFPEAVRSRLINGSSGKNRIRYFLSGKTDEIDDSPIADLFPHTTVIFMDIAGFTAWSSTRDPSQVFILLQTIYQAFDVIAKRSRVFKVETIGDSYVAVCGLPNPNQKHFLTVSRFAWKCLGRFGELTKRMEARLGPDTADLGLRLGLHSGPVTAGVLRGERSRFQLFGDTVNTASSMENTSQRNKIQVSAATARLLHEAGKEHWLTKREDKVTAKGLGSFDTYWLNCNQNNHNSNDMSESHASDFGSTADSQETTFAHLLPPPESSSKEDRLISWIVDLLLNHIRDIVQSHAARGVPKDPDANLVYFPPDNKTRLDEVVDVIKLPRFDENLDYKPDEQKAEIDEVVIRQLHQVVTIIAGTYRDNHFHNFEHACHVTMCVDKFLTRIVTPDIDPNTVKNEKDIASTMHDYTHGINSDPMTLLAIVFSALIHDADHRGISNAQLCKEDDKMASVYRSKCVAEQNSVDIAWSILMSQEYKELRSAVFSNREELLRFRQVVVNVVLATDIFDGELKDLRNRRWKRAFDLEGPIDSDLRATIVIEHIIQASDVSHTMQHWHIYRKWNQNLFRELYTAYKQDRMGADPCQFWYKGEIGFFDNYILPLAKKLKNCNVFGASSDECLNFALQNRHEWEDRGQEIVAAMIEEVQVMKIAPPAPPPPSTVKPMLENESDGSTVEC